MFLPPTHCELVDTYPVQGGVVFVWRLDGVVSFLVETFAATTVNQ